VTRSSAPSGSDPSGLSPLDLQKLAGGIHHDPHSVLGAHPVARSRSSQAGLAIRALHPEAKQAWLLPEGAEPIEMRALGMGVFAAFVVGARAPLRYRQRFGFADGTEWERDDPYRFAPTLGELDLHLFGEGTHRRLWEVLGARVRSLDGVAGTSFAVWAPAAQGVAVVGEFCGWDGRLLPMRSLGSSGVWELFVPGAEPGALYKYEIHTPSGDLRIKTDPLARYLEPPPGNASIVHRSD